MLVVKLLSRLKICPEVGPVGSVSTYNRCYFAILHEIREAPVLEKFIKSINFWSKIVDF